MPSYHNIERSAFRRREYVGYGGGMVWRIFPCASRWWCMAHDGQQFHHMQTDTLKDASWYLENWRK